MPPLPPLSARGGGGGAPDLLRICLAMPSFRSTCRAVVIQLRGSYPENMIRLIIYYFSKIRFYIIQD